MEGKERVSKQNPRGGSSQPGVISALELYTIEDTDVTDADESCIGFPEAFPIHSHPGDGEAVGLQRPKNSRIVANQITQLRG